MARKFIIYCGKKKNIVHGSLSAELSAIYIGNNTRILHKIQ